MSNHLTLTIYSLFCHSKPTFPNWLLSFTLFRMQLEGSHLEHDFRVVWLISLSEAFEGASGKTKL